MTRILLTGAGGMLGRDLVEVLADHTLTTTTRQTLDITDPVDVDDAVSHHDVVINAAAYTAVDQAESEPDEAFAVNATGPQHLARAASRHGTRLIHISTDYVFDGRATTPYPEDAPRNPQSVYGRTKAAGEEAIEQLHPDGSIIVRTAWLYGQHGTHFPKTMLQAATTRDSLDVVTDQIGQPTWSHDLAGMIAILIDAGISHGVFHGTNSGQASWFDFAQAIFRRAGLDPDRIRPTTSEAFVRPATRPAWSVLGHDSWAHHGLPSPRNWHDAWDEAFDVCFPEYRP